MVRCIDVEPLGQWLVSGETLWALFRIICIITLLGSSDNTLKLWEISTGRCVNTISLETTPDSVVFCPNQELTLVAVTVYGCSVI